MCGVYVCAYNIHWSTAVTLIKGFTQSWKGAAAELYGVEVKKARAVSAAAPSRLQH
jgi:hypothetical protein